jgi:hypothetical protein
LASCDTARDQQRGETQGQRKQTRFVHVLLL